MLDFDYTVKRTTRKKTASVSVKDEVVTLVVPNTLSDEDVEKLVRKKSRWIREKLEFNKKVQESHKPKEYISGESFSYLGRNHRLKVVDGETGKVSLKNGYFTVSIPTNITESSKQDLIKSELSEWYRVHALKKLIEKSKRFAKQIGVSPSNIEIKEYKSRWGGCSHAGVVSFNWHIIMAPNRIVDYVVVHELCHLIHHDHSEKYWKLVEAVFPDWRECKEWLKVNGKGLIL